MSSLCNPTSSSGFEHYHRLNQIMPTCNADGRRNTFLNNVKEMCHRHGFQFQKIRGHAEALSSADFCFEIPTTPYTNYSLHNLPSVIEDDLRDTYDLYTKGPFRRSRRKNQKSQSLVFIASSLTEQWLADNLISESFSTANRLYQYLNWTMRMANVALSAKCPSIVTLEGRRGASVMVIDTELHDHDGHLLYALCIPNDIVAPKTQKWQMAALLTAAELSDLLRISPKLLPYGVRASSSQFSEYNRSLRTSSEAQTVREMKRFIADQYPKIKPICYQQIKCVKTNTRNEEIEHLRVSLTAFSEAVGSALDDDRVSVIPMVSITTKKRRGRRFDDFSVDYLLPVPIDDNWVGVVYRNGVPQQALMDHHDITNKVLLCCPSFDVERVSMFKNARFNRLRLVSDDDMDSVQSVRSITDSHAHEMSVSPCPLSPAQLPRDLTPGPVPVSPLLTPQPNSHSFEELKQIPPLVVMDLSSVDELLQVVDQIVVRGERNALFYGQFLSCGQ